MNKSKQADNKGGLYQHRYRHKFIAGLPAGGRPPWNLKRNLVTRTQETSGSHLPDYRRYPGILPAGITYFE